jgi:lipopolysaccharide biosynthesis regulator YciM
MVVSDLICLLLLALVAVIITLQWRKKQTPSKDAAFARDYFTGLNYLLNEEPDAAVDVFIKLIEVDSDTVETHLALGGLFRRRGEVDRAIRVHQNIIARPSLSKSQRYCALNELAQDYMKAGVLDRAESLFLELNNSPDYYKSSLENLIDIYQQQRDWNQAIEIAEKLAHQAGKPMGRQIAHYHCELAEKELERGDLESAQRLIKNALKSDSNNVRVHLLQAELHFKSHRYQQAIQSYGWVVERHAAFFHIVMAPLLECYEALGKKSDFLKFVQKHIHSKPEALIFSEELLPTITEQMGQEQVANLLQNVVQQRPSLHGLKQLLVVLTQNHHPHKEATTLKLITDLLKTIVKSNPAFRCECCGFSGKIHFWQCPSCRTWDSLQSPS